MLVPTGDPPRFARVSLMIHGPRTGSIEVIAGVMFSGKSEELLRRVRRAEIARRRVQVFKSHLDERYAGLKHVSSHDGRSLEAVPIGTAGELMRLIRPDTEIVAIDEAQFLDDAIVDVATGLANRGVRVILRAPIPTSGASPSGPWPS
jgi:thymidine kinase